MQAPLLDRECILLAAGESRRMGRAKQFLMLDGVPLMRLVLERVMEVCARVIVVTGAVDVASLLPDSPRISLVGNPDWTSGQLGSLQKGLRILEGSGAFIMLADLPLIRSATFRTLERAAGAAPAAFPVCEGRRGHPVLVGREGVELLLAAPPEERAMRVLRPLDPQPVEVDDPGIYFDVDTPEAWEDLRRKITAG